MRVASYRRGNQVGSLTPHVREAVDFFGLVKREKASDLAAWISEQNASEQDGRGDVLRRTGRELSKEDKAALGLEPRYRLTYEALDLLTEKGREDPKHSLDITIRRATSSMIRQLRTAQVVEAVQSDIGRRLYAGLEFDTFHDRCAPAAAMEGRLLQPKKLPSLPLKGCVNDVCHCGFRPRRSKLRNRQPESSEKKSGFFARLFGR